jgi:hypothetical protein
VGGIQTCARLGSPHEAGGTLRRGEAIPNSNQANGTTGGEGSALQIRATDYTLTRTPDGGLLLELAGKVRVEYQGRRLEGERLLLDTDASLVRSEEPFRLFAEQGALTGRRGEYYYTQARGRFEGVQANVLGVYLDAASLEGELTDFEARAVVVSTCDPFRPPIQVRAGRVRLVRGARLTLRNARLFVYGQPLPSLPQLTVRVGETAEVVSLPSPVYSAETGWGARARLELPLGARALLQASTTGYLRAVPEVRAAVGVALRGDEPALGDPDIRLRFEQSALYNLRVRPERTPAVDALTLRAEIARDVRPLLAPRERLRVSRTELALIAPLQYAGGFGEASLRYGSLSERIDGQRTPTRERLALESDWFQPLLGHGALQLRLHLWASYARYAGVGNYQWLRPQLELLWQPTSSLTLMAGYARASTRGDSPFLSEQLRARREASLRRVPAGQPAAGRAAQVRLGAARPVRCASDSRLARSVLGAVPVLAAHAQRGAGGRQPDDAGFLDSTSATLHRARIRRVSLSHQSETNTHGASRIESSE